MISSGSTSQFAGIFLSPELKQARKGILETIITLSCDPTRHFQQRFRRSKSARISTATSHCDHGERSSVQTFDTIQHSLEPEFRSRSDHGQSRTVSKTLAFRVQRTALVAGDLPGNLGHEGRRGDSIANMPGSHAAPGAISPGRGRGCGTVEVALRSGGRTAGTPPISAAAPGVHPSRRRWAVCLGLRSDTGDQDQRHVILSRCRFSNAP